MNKYDKLLAVAKHINKYWSAGHHFTAFGHLQNKLYEAIQECEEDKQLQERYIVRIDGHNEWEGLKQHIDVRWSDAEYAAFPAFRYYMVNKGKCHSRHPEHSAKTEDCPIYTFSEWQSMQKGGENCKSSHVSVAHDGADYKTPVLINGTDSVEIKTPEKSFQKELEALINRYSMENDSDTPDYILAEYLYSCLFAFGIATKKRSEYYRKPLINKS